MVDNHMKSFSMNWAKGEISEKAGYLKTRRIVELVTQADNLLACINCPQPLNFADCVCNIKKNGFARILTVKIRSDMDFLV